MIVNGYTLGPDADLTGADLMDADLTGADLRGASTMGIVINVNEADPQQVPCADSVSVGIVDERAHSKSASSS